MVHFWTALVKANGHHRSNQAPRAPPAAGWRDHAYWSYAITLKRCIYIHNQFETVFIYSHSRLSQLENWCILRYGFSQFIFAVHGLIPTRYLSAIIHSSQFDFHVWIVIFSRNARLRSAWANGPPARPVQTCVERRCMIHIYSLYNCYHYFVNDRRRRSLWLN